MRNLYQGTTSLLQVCFLNWLQQKETVVNISLEKLELFCYIPLIYSIYCLLRIGESTKFQTLLGP